MEVHITRIRILPTSKHFAIAFLGVATGVLTVLASDPSMQSFSKMANPQAAVSLSPGSTVWSIDGNCHVCTLLSFKQGLECCIACLRVLCFVCKPSLSVDVASRARPSMSPSCLKSRDHLSSAPP